MKAAMNVLPDLTLSNYADLDHAGSFVFAPFLKKLKWGGGGGTVPHMVDVQDLRRIPGYNVRVKGVLYRKRVEHLAALMLDHGFDEATPLVGMLGREGERAVVYIKQGNTRLDAIEAANDAGASILQVPVLWSAEQMNGADFTLDLILSNSGSPLSLFEQGLAYNRSANEGLSNCEMARRTGVSEGHVRNARDLAKVPERLVEALAAGAIAETLALELWRAFGDDVVERLDAALEVAARQNRRKLVRSMFWAPAPARHVGAQAVDALERFSLELRTDALKHILSAIVGTGSDRAMISVPAHLLRGLAGTTGTKLSKTALSARNEYVATASEVEQVVGASLAPVPSPAAALSPADFLRVEEAEYEREPEEAVARSESPHFCEGEIDKAVDTIDVVRDRSDVDPIPEFEVNQDCDSW